MTKISKCRKPRQSKLEMCFHFEARDHMNVFLKTTLQPFFQVLSRDIPTILAAIEQGKATTEAAPIDAKKGYFACLYTSSVSWLIPLVFCRSKQNDTCSNGFLVLVLCCLSNYMFCLCLLIAFCLSWLEGARVPDIPWNEHSTWTWMVGIPHRIHVWCI